MKPAQAVKPKPRVAVGQASKPRAAQGVAGNKPASGGGAGVGGARPAGPAKAPYGSQLAAANPPPAAAMPWDSAYDTSAAAARAKYQNALISLGYNKTALQQDYGLDQGFNDFKTNPYSRAAALENAYQRANRSSQTSLGSSGQLYAGSLQNQLGYNRSNRDQGDHELRAAYQSALQELRGKELAAGDELRSDLGEAAWRRVENAMEAPLDPSVGSAGSPARGSHAKTKGGKKYGIGKATPVAPAKRRKR